MPNVHKERNTRTVAVRMDEYTALRMYHVARLLHVRPHVIIERGVKMFINRLERQYPPEWLKPAVSATTGKVTVSQTA